MAEVFVTFTEPLEGPDGTAYLARVCGGEMDDGRWQGWLEFAEADGAQVLRSARETTQPNRADLAYWATGLTLVYLEGSLERTLRPGPVAPPTAPPVTPTFDAPAPPAHGAAPQAEAILNPYSVFRKGEAVLRGQLEALAAWHLVNIVRAYQLSAEPPEVLDGLTAGELVELIVTAVKEGTPVGG